MKHPEIQVGQRFGRLTVLKTRTSAGQHPKALVRCDCGTERAVSIYNLNSGNTTSCGCSRIRSQYNKHPLRGAWFAMKYRCENPEHVGYRNYGARGIRVCDRWQNFETFIADIERLIGPRPAGHSLDRIDNDGNYEPGNVRWATQAQQNANKRPRKMSNEAVASYFARWQAGESFSALAREADVHSSVMLRRVRKYESDQGVMTRVA